MATQGYELESYGKGVEGIVVHRLRWSEAEMREAETVMPEMPHPVLTPSASQSSACSQSHAEEPNAAGQSIGHDFVGLSIGPPDSRSASWWFISPDTWTIDDAPEELKKRPRSAVELTHTMAKIHRWLAQWVDGDSNPFIHHQLYRHRFPQSVQDAYMVLSCYLHRKPSNEQAIFRIVQDRARQLVEQDTLSAHSQLGTVIITSATLDPLEHLARSHALLIYQLISLYDGNIRLRCIAESHVPVLDDWMRQAVDRASRSGNLGSFLVSPSNTEAAYRDVPWEKLVWHSWIIAESLRRTWLVASAVQGVYMTSQDGLAHCLGGMMFTSRQGFWEATSALAWQKRCSEVYGGLIRLTETDKLFTFIAPEDLDDFAKVILEVTFGMEQMERWGVDASNSS
ncbi:MAG: hypothetical protein M1820_002123 [Bogoriella megaspora]|nr:MAG: hypothetical protein M1820_002123 [Bogoriella megaspora]